MAFDLSSPVAKLAFEMALRNQQTIDSGSQFDAEARAAVSNALKYGNETLPGYEDIYRSYVDPAETQRRAQAQAFNAYLVGLPELLAKSRKEMGGSGGASSTLIGNPSGYMTPAERFNQIMAGILGSTAPKTVTVPKRTTVYPTTRFADTEERRQTLNPRSL